MRLREVADLPLQRHRLPMARETNLQHTCWRMIVMTLTHFNSAINAPSIRKYLFSRLFRRSLAALATWSGRRRQKLALERLDNRLRDDVGLPPRPKPDVTRLRADFSGLF